MADDYIRLSELPEANDEQMTEKTLMEVSVVNAETSSGFETRKTPLSRLANYILNKFSALNLGGSTRTVKAAIDKNTEDISTLTNLATQEPISVTASSDFTLGINNSFRIGNLVILSFKIIGVNAAADTAVVIGETAIHPSTEVNILYSANTNVPCHGWIRTNGEIVLFSTSSTLSNREIRAYAIYTVSND